MKILVTGASGYVGGRLIPLLLERGHHVVVMARDPRRVLDRDWSDRVTVVTGDLMEPASLAPAFEGVEAAYYLVHSMYGGKDFAARDRQAALHFVRAAAGVSQVIYLGGLLPETSAGRRSAHLESRAEVGRILRQHLPTTEVRAGPIIGSGSASFEMVRYLTERLPAMIAPRWILNPVQPIAVRDVLAYLVGVLGRADCHGILEVGAPPLTFRQMMQGYAQVRGLPRWILPVPVLAPRLAARWVGLVTPIPNTLAIPLVEGVVKPLLADTRRARELMPEIQPLTYQEAVRRAIEHTQSGDVITRWSGALGDASADGFEDREGVFREVRTRHVDTTQDHVYAAFSRLGGERGWLVWNWAWRLRGMLDRLVGGPGLRRGRRHPSQVLPGEAIDFWRVEEACAPDRLRLRAEMKVPGRAWLQWEAIPEEGGTRLVQTAFFAPTGLLGFLYWYGIYPVHARIFSDLVDAVAREAMAHPREPHDTRPDPTAAQAGRTGLEGSN